MTLKHPILIIAVLVSAGGAIVAGILLSPSAITPSEPSSPDVTSSNNNSPSTSSETQTSLSSQTRTDGPLYFTTMTHMEGTFPDDTDRAVFERHAKSIRWAMALFDEYGVKLTIESEQSFAKANAIWGDNVLADVLAHGHGVGTHADFGAGPRDHFSVAELSARFKENKALVDALVGAEHNTGVSGGTGPTDWAIAASNAGFLYMDALTGFGYLSMPIAERPNGWTDTYIRKTTYHDSIPVDFAERIYPLSLANAQDLVSDTNPVITVMGGDIGELSSIHEDRKTCAPNCVFTEDDIRAVEQYIQTADTMRDRSAFSRINTHIPVTLLVEKNESLLRSLLSMLASYAETNTLQFATQQESYNAFMAREGGDR
jgi:hypothetical protein